MSRLDEGLGSQTCSFYIRILLQPRWDVKCSYLYSHVNESDVSTQLSPDGFPAVFLASYS